jgi:outer membrane receptor protein involved in Fe transport
MTLNLEVARAVRRALLMGAVAASASLAAHAQEQSTQVETVTVTGSRIVRQDFEAPSPVVTVDADTFKLSGEVQVEAVLNTLPQLVPSITTTSNNPSNGGQANVDLRGFGTSRTLVLLDGTRLVGSNVTGVIDLNTIPSALIENVEILTGGASSTYGSDAVAGVVNVRLKQNFSGVQLNVQSNRTAESDGKTLLAEGLIGGNFAEGRGNAVVALAYDKRDAVLAGARPFSNVSLGPKLTPAGSPSVPDGSVAWGTNAPTQAALNTVFARYGAAAGSVLPSTTLGFNPDQSLFSFGNIDSSTINVVNYKGDTSDPGFNPSAYSYNFAPTNYLQLPLERRQIAAFTRYDIMPESNGSTAELYSRVMYTTYHSDQQLASTPVTCSGTQAGCAVPLTNTVIPADLRELALSRTVNPNANLVLNKRITEVGPRTQENGYDVVQGLLGFRGAFKLGEHDFNWDIFGSWGRAEGTSLQGGNVSRSKLQAALNNPAVYAGQGCASFNPFGAGALAKECAQQIAINATNVLVTETSDFVASVTGDLFKMPAGAVKFAAGAEYREDQAKFRPDQFLASGDVVGFNAQQPVSGSINVKEPFAELSIPLLADKSFAQYVGLDLGYRHSEYNLAGGANTYKATLEWNPIHSVKLRGGYNRSIRAPNISELFLPVQENFPAATDPCSSAASNAFRNASNPDKAKVEALCVAQGIPAASLATYTQPASQIKSFIGGDTTLKPEKADGYSFGVVFQSDSDSEWLHSLNLSLDYYRIKIDDVINNLSTSSVIGRCFNQLNSNPTFDPGNQFCQLFTRQTTGNLGITDVLTVTDNLSSWKGSGVDINLNWGVPLSAFGASEAAGKLDFKLLMTHLLSRSQQETNVDPFIERDGTISSTVGSSYPTNKGVLATFYTVGSWQFRYNLRYVDSLDVVNNDATLTASTGVKPAVPTYLYHDLTAKWSINDMFALTGGITNLADKAPPVYTTSSGVGIQANTDPSTYDVLGRRYFLNVMMKF